MASRNRHRPGPDRSFYTGDLATPLKVGTPNRKAEIDRRMGLLFDWHRIQRNDFLGLALALAFAHVPGLHNERRGRPPKKRGENWLATFYSRPLRGAGRSRLWSEDMLLHLVKFADEWKAEPCATGEKRRSDRRFVTEVICPAIAKRTGRRLNAVRKDEERAFASALSRGRRLVSKLTEK